MCLLMLLSLRTRFSSCPPWNILHLFIKLFVYHFVIHWSFLLPLKLQLKMQTILFHHLFSHTRMEQITPYLPTDSSDSNPPPPNSQSMDHSSPLPSPNSNYVWPIAHRQGKRSTHNPYPFYNFLSYHHLSPSYFSYSFSLSK